MLKHAYVCPDCKNDLDKKQESYYCPNCSVEFRIVKEIPVFDLKLLKIQDLESDKGKIVELMHDKY